MRLIGLFFVALIILVSKLLFGQNQFAYSDYRFNTISSEDGLLQSSVLSMLQDYKGYIWLGTKYGVYRYNGYKLVSYRQNLNDSSSIGANEIIQLCTDQNNDILIGTRGGGLYKYIYSKDCFIQIKGIPENASIFSLYFDNANTLWVGTEYGFYKGHISKGSNYTFKNVTTTAIYQNYQNSLIPSSKSLMSVVSMLHLADNIFLVGSEIGVLYYNAINNIFTQVNLPEVDFARISSIEKDSKGRICIGSSEGVLVVNNLGRADQETAYYGINAEAGKRLPLNWINKILLDKDENIWGGTRGGGLFKIDTEGELTVFKSDKNKGYLSDNVINSLLIDKTDVLWIGTESRGCLTLDLNRKRFKHIEVKYTDKVVKLDQQVTAITGNGSNTIWIGTAFDGISKLTKKETGENVFESISNIQAYAKMPSNEIIDLHADKNDNLWVGMAINSLVHINKNNEINTYPTEGFVFNIHEDKNGNIWYGTWGNGFGKVNATDYSINKFTIDDNRYQALSNNIVLCIIDDKFDNLWVGTKGGGLNIASIKLLDLGKKSFTYYTHAKDDKESLSCNDVSCIYNASDGSIWVGTAKGLNKVIYPEGQQNYSAVLQGKLKFKSFFEEDGLPNNMICGIIEDEFGNLWISTLDGLSKFDTESEKFKNYTHYDGLQASEFHTNASYKLNNKEFYFGGINGVTVFNPGEIGPNPYHTNTVITSLKIFDKIVKPNEKVNDRIILNKNIADVDSIVLSPKHKEFTFEFSGMHFSNTSKVQYAYRLVGFNDDWRLTEKKVHSATFSNIHEGEYLFQVKSTNNDGVWDEKYAEIYIKVLPPFWRKPFVVTLYFIAILILLFFFRKYSLIAVNEKNNLRFEALERKKAEEITEAKTRFFTNISHEIRTPLTLIYSPLEKIIASKNIDKENYSNLKLVKKNVQRLLSLTNQLLQLRKIDIGILEPSFEKVRIVEYVQDILDHFENHTSRRSIAITLNTEGLNENETVWVDKEMITTALYNLLSNAFKFCSNKGYIKVTIDTKHADTIFKRRFNKKQRKVLNYLNIKIANSGTTIPTTDLEKVFDRFYQSSNHNEIQQAGSGIGLSIVKDYIELHQGMVKASSIENKETIMDVFLPLGDKHISKQQKKEEAEKTENALLPQLTPLTADNDIVIEPNTSTNKVNKVHLLIVDDDADMLNFLSNHFKHKYSVSNASNGRIALGKAQKHLPNLILSDVMMPEIGGLELCDKIKSNIETSHIPIILLTAKVGDENEIKGYENGADMYISKPFSVSVLEAKVEQLLDSRRNLIDIYSKKILLKPKDITITSTDEKFMMRLMDIVESNMGDSEFDVAQMVDKMNMSHSAVLKKLKALTDTSLVDFVRRHRLNKAALIFSKDKIPVNEVAYMVGFSDPKYFSKCFSKQFGKTPTEFLNNPELQEDLI